MRSDGAKLEIWPSDYVRQDEQGQCALAFMPSFHGVNSQGIVLGDAGAAPVTRTRNEGKGRQKGVTA